jgi:hypothetical protein
MAPSAIANRRIFGTSCPGGESRANDSNRYFEQD